MGSFYLMTIALGTLCLQFFFSDTVAAANMSTWEPPINSKVVYLGCKTCKTFFFGCTSDIVAQCVMASRSTDGITWKPHSSCSARGTQNADETNSRTQWCNNQGNQTDCHVASIPVCKGSILPCLYFNTECNRYNPTCRNDDEYCDPSKCARGQVCDHHCSIYSHNKHFIKCD